MPKSSGKHAKYYTGKGLDGNKLYMARCDLNIIQSKVKRTKLCLVGSFQTRISKYGSQSKNSFQLSMATS